MRINDLPGAGPEVVERIRAAALSLGRRPNLTASLRRSDGHSATIDVLLVLAHLRAPSAHWRPRRRSNANDFASAAIKTTSARASARLGADR